MAEIVNDTTQATQPTGQQTQGFVCNGDCLKCSQQQRLYCAAQHGQQMFRMMSAVLVQLGEINTAIGDIRKRTDAVQSAESDVFNPLVEKRQEADKPLV